MTQLHVDESKESHGGVTLQNSKDLHHEKFEALSPVGQITLDMARFCALCDANCRKTQRRRNVTSEAKGPTAPQTHAVCNAREAKQ